MPAIDMISKEELVDLLRKCQEQFRFYGRNHRAKMQPLKDEMNRLPAGNDYDAERRRFRDAINDAGVKAGVNEHMDRTIGLLIGETPGMERPPIVAAVSTEESRLAAAAQLRSMFDESGKFCLAADVPLDRIGLREKRIIEHAAAVLEL